MDIFLKMKELKPLKTSSMYKKRHNYLIDNGWELSFESETMLKYKKQTSFFVYELYVNSFLDNDSTFYGCNLYTDKNEDDVEYFSYRNMISQLKNKIKE